MNDLSYDDVDKEITRFFSCPSTKLPDGRRPLLYLIRRDLEALYGIEGCEPKKDQIAVPFLTSLGVMVGFEILTKFWSGDETVNSRKVESFFEEVGRLSKDKAIALRQFRHALSHGYRLTTKDLDSNIYSYRLSSEPDDLLFLVKDEEDRYIINVWKLKEFFLDTIERYRKELLFIPKRKENFKKALPKMGEILISD